MTAANRSTAYHEAGHVIAHCHLLSYIDEARVLKRPPREQSGYVRSLERPAHPWDVHSSVGQYLKESVPYARRPMMRAHMVESGKRHVMVLLAGAITENRLQPEPSTQTFLTLLTSGGINDFGKVARIADFLYRTNAQREAFMRECAEQTFEFIRKPKVWRQVEAVAEVLMTKGKITGRHPLLRRIVPWQPV